MQRKNEIIELSNDHLPYNHNESIRIIKAGGYIDENGRLNGMLFVNNQSIDFFLLGTLSFSRSIGDLEFK
jgi:serine/threonine protein phosphatase PrpC